MVSLLLRLGLACTLGVPVPAGAPELPLDPEYVARAWTSAEGLPQDTVNAITRTRDGYLWLATFGGLARFDGVRFETYTIAEHPELGTNRIVSLYEDAAGDLWLGTEGRGVVRLRNGRFESFQDGAPGGAVWDVLEDPDGDLLFAGQGLSVFRHGRCVPLVPRDLPVFDLHVDRAGRLWLGTGDGLKVLDGGDLQDVAADGAPLLVTAVRDDPAGRLWIAGEGQVGHVEDGAFVPLAAGPGDFPERLLVDDRGALWFAQGGELLSLDPPAGGAPATRPQVRLALPAGARSLYADGAGGVWVGTSGAGLLRAARTPIARLRGALGTGIADVFRHGRDGVWFPTGGAIHLWRGDGLEARTRRQLGLPPDALLVGETSDGRLWARNESGLLRARDGVAEMLAAPPGLGGLVEAADGTVWIGAVGELLSVRGRELRRHPVPGWPRTYWRVDLVAADGSLWFHGPDAVGRRSVGPEGERLDVWGAAEGLPSGEVRALHRDARGTVWIATYGSGLVHLRDGVLTRLGEEQGLADLALGGILEDDDGRLWINSNRGLLVAPIEPLEAVVRGERRRAPCRVVQSGEGNGGSAHRTPDGRLWFPAVDALVVADPGALELGGHRPGVRVERVVADGVRLDPGELDGSIALLGGVHALEVHYTGFDFDAPEQLRFRYLLEGYEHEWTEADHRRSAYFTKVPPGRYVFRVRAEREDGVRSEADATVALELEPRFYQTPWFVVLCAAAVGAAAFGLHRARVLEVERHAAELRREIVERERAERERRQLEERLRESAKAEALGRLSGGLAHDFNNVLTAILGRAALLEQSLDAPAGDGEAGRRREHLEEIATSARRAAALTQQLLAFSRRQVLQPTTLRPADVVTDLTPMLRQLLPENVELDLRPDPDPGHVHVDEGQLQQVVMNLVLNARDALPDGGTITVATAQVDVDDAAAAGRPGTSAGPYVELAVTDTGPGLGPDELPHVFDPFFAADERGRGTGLGLASVHGIVNQSGGHVLVSSEVGRGTTFRALLPRVPAARPAPADEAIAPDGVGGTETILVCEDDDAIRRMVRMLLEPQGYTVLAASRPRRALELAGTIPSIDLLITDVVMPEMSGRDLAETLVERHPETQVLYVSGYTSDVIVHQGVVEEGIRFLDKPFTPTELLTTVRGLLDAQRDGDGERSPGDNGRPG